MNFRDLSIGETFRKAGDPTVLVKITLLHASIPPFYVAAPSAPRTYPYPFAIDFTSYRKV